jgi:hypothetical protein
VNYLRSIKALYDRTQSYSELLNACREAGRKSVRAGSREASLKALGRLESKLQSIQAGDFFPGKASGKASRSIQALRRDIELRFSPSEPIARMDAIATRSIDAFQKRTWATRQRPWIDRLATAWLVQRFVDRSAHFVWIKSPTDCPKGAIGFDYHGATFTHVNNKVTFEVVAHTFGLCEDEGIGRIGDLVHYIDVGGLAVDEAAGVEAVVRGLRAQHPDDDELLNAALPLFDSLYADGLVQP